MQGMVQKVDDVEFIYYEQLGGNMVRVDILNSKRVKDIKKYSSYEIVDSYPNGDRKTYYIKPVVEPTKNEDVIVDSISQEDSYTIFRLERDIEQERGLLETSQGLFNKEEKSNNTVQMGVYGRWVDESISKIDKLELELKEFLSKLTPSQLEFREREKQQEIERATKNGQKTKKTKEAPVETYTCSTGITYKTSSMYVYTDNDGNYRSFSDDTKKHLETYEKSLGLWKKILEKATNRGDVREEEFCRKWIAQDEKMIEKLKKDLMKGL